TNPSSPPSVDANFINNLNCAQGDNKKVLKVIGFENLPKQQAGSSKHSTARSCSPRPKGKKGTRELANLNSRICYNKEKSPRQHHPPPSSAQPTNSSRRATR
ncbi:hypothetical protein AMTR_s00167p00027640, partial [Amborella trichopoda]